MQDSGRKLIVVLVDGLRDDTARMRMGFMEGLIEQGQGLRARVQSVLPSLSRPCYEAICTGTQPTVNGIWSNDTVRLSTQTSIFDVLHRQRQTAGIVGYHWLSELYCHSPFDHARDRERNEPGDRIAHGRFYFEDSYPDSHVFAEAEGLRNRHQPDFLLVHTMGVDDAGHRFGASSMQYAGQVARVDMLLARLTPVWLAHGINVIVTADHGMGEIGFHGGPAPEERLAPLYLISSLLGKNGIDDEHILPQTSMAALFCRMLEVEPASSMGSIPADIESHWFSPSTSE